LARHVLLSRGTCPARNATFHALFAASMRTIKLTLAYDGTAYAGWQVQSQGKTIQGVLESTLAKITGEAVRVTASGRTDAGVHALGQVVGFRTESRLRVEVLKRALNAELPRDVAVLEAAEAPEGFHATLHARRKRYRYLIYDGPVRDVFRLRTAWHCPRGLDVETMHRAAQALCGTHDFSSFETCGSQRKTSIRTVFDISVRRGVDGDPHLVAVEVEANGFLYNMVRTIVGTLAKVGRHARSESWVAEVLAAADRRAAGPTAPPQGLFLVRVEYE
jgi:tRNA pseudouridine38-40 synthase